MDRDHISIRKSKWFDCLVRFGFVLYYTCKGGIRNYLMSCGKCESSSGYNTSIAINQLNQSAQSLLLCNQHCSVASLAFAALPPMNYNKASGIDRYTCKQTIYKYSKSIIDISKYYSKHSDVDSKLSLMISMLLDTLIALLRSHPRCHLLPHPLIPLRHPPVLPFLWIDLNYCYYLGMYSFPWGVEFR